MRPTFPTLAEFFADLPGGDVTDRGTARRDKMSGTEADDTQLGLAGNDLLKGEGGSDVLFGGRSNDRLYGGDDADLIRGGGGNDRSYGGDGDDYILDFSGNNKVDAGSGDDVVRTGRGKDKIYGGEGDDVVGAGGGRDLVYGGAGDDVIWGMAGRDKISGGDGDDMLFGGRDNDRLYDGWGDDEVYGGSGRDKIYTQFGNDLIKGGRGNDWIESRSDSGEPIIAENPDGDLYYPEEPLTDADDVIYGGRGADTFYFRLDIDAKAEIAAKHVMENGMIHWHGVAGENNNDHDHWVNGIGNDTIKDFKLGTDKILIEGHTTNAAVEHIDLDDNGTLESTRIVLYSDQGAGGGAHNQDKLGTITVENVQLSDGDITVDAGVHYGAHKTLDDLIAYGVELYGSEYEL